MPVSLFSTTGALRFRPFPTVVDRVLGEGEPGPVPAEPDEIIEPPPGQMNRSFSLSDLGPVVALLLVFGILQAVVLMPPVFLSGTLAN